MPLRSVWGASRHEEICVFPVGRSSLPSLELEMLQNEEYAMVCILPWMESRHGCDEQVCLLHRRLNQRNAVNVHFGVCRRNATCNEYRRLARRALVRRWELRKHIGRDGGT